MQRSAFTFFCSAALFAATAAAAPQTLPVRRGTPTADFSSTGIFVNDQVSCSATLIPNSSCIITAGHCAVGYASNLFSLDKEIAKVTDVEYVEATGGLLADLAIGKLSRKLTPKGGADFSLAPADLRLEQGQEVTIVGYGDPGRGLRFSSPVRRQGTMRVGGYLEDSELEGSFSSTTITLFPGETDNALCSGDSGGPVFEGKTLVGINSAGIGSSYPDARCVHEMRPERLIALRQIYHATSERATSERATSERRLRRKGRGCGARGSTGISTGAGCVDLSSGLVWSRGAQRGEMRRYLTDLAQLESLGREGAVSQTAALAFCSALNNPALFKQQVADQLGYRRGSEYSAALDRIAGRSREWRLPSAAELASVSGRRGRSRELNLGGPGRPELYWSADRKGNEAIAIYSTSGKIRALPDIPTACDLEEQSEATSVAHYREWIDRTMDQLGCWASHS